MFETHTGLQVRSRPSSPNLCRATVPLRSACHNCIHFFGTSVVFLWLAVTGHRVLAEEELSGPLPSAKIECGDLVAEFLDNAQSPKILSGVDRLFHTKEAPDFDAFDPHDPPASAGLNYEHIISGHSDPANWFAPRNGPYRLYRRGESNTVVLWRRAEEDPWALESLMTYTLTAPHYIDFHFTCVPHDARRFGDRRSAVLFWADYMNDVEDVALHFRGVQEAGGDETWIAADAPPGHVDYVGGGTYRHAESPGFAYDADHNFKLNLWSYEYPRFTQPFYYGRAAHGMVFMLMFDRSYSEIDEMRFSLFKFKVSEQTRRPAWDFQYVMHRIETGRPYGFRGRLVWKKFVSEEDCQQEYAEWSAGLRDQAWRSELPILPPSESATDSSRGTATATRGWELPPVAPVTRVNPRLMNYFHMDLKEGRAEEKEARLAQWNLLILNHDQVEQEKLSLAKIRKINPRIRILAWVPLQGPNNGLAPGVPPVGENDWFAYRADGSLLVPHWGGHLMNVYAHDYAWPRHVLDYVRRVCLTPGGYNGLMMDCLWQTEPDQQDVNRDGIHDRRDTEAWQAGMLFLLKSLREQYPQAILTGNGGGPWSEDCPYYEYANGCMHENALGDVFGGVTWQSLWDGYCRTMKKVTAREPFHLMAVDVRADGRNQLAANWLWWLSQNDRRRARLGLATSLLMDGGYFGFDRGDCLHGQLWWLREYDVDLGQPIAPYEVNRFGDGVYSRKFEHGLVIVNPSDNVVSVKTDALFLDASTGVQANEFLVPANDARIFAGDANR